VTLHPSIALVLLLTAGCQKAPAQSATPAAQAPAAAQTADSPSPEAAQAAGQSVESAQAGGAAAEQADAPAIKPVPAELPDVLARVNGEAITKAEFDRALFNVELRAGQPVPAEERNRVYRGVLDQLVTFHLLLQEVKSRQISVSDTEVGAQIDQLKQRFPSEDEFQKALASRKVTLDVLREDTRKEMAVARMVEAEVKPKVRIQESEVKDYYDKNPNQFQQPQTFRASHILIGVDGAAGADEKKAAREKAEALLKRAKNGEDFAALAREHSDDGGSKTAGGDLNYFQKGQMVPEFQAAVESLTIGEISGIVESQFGYHIVLLTDTRPARTIPLAEVSTRIGQYLTTRAHQEKAGEFLQALKARGKIEILI
jgi:peptidyl-prolyl cis-trans isomerase C